MTDTELLQLQDRARLADLVVTYSRRLDDGDHAGYSELFAANGRLEAALGVADGPEAIRALLDERRGVRVGQPRQSVHLVGNQLIEVDGDRATATTWWTFLETGVGSDTGPALVKGGEYFDEFVRVDGDWRIAVHRIVRMTD